MTTSSNDSGLPRLAAGRILTGKRNGRRYVVEGLLGEGANGAVYLVRSGSRVRALKLGRNPVDLQSEVNTLRKLAAAGVVDPDYLRDVDDVRFDGRDLPFYVMTYVQGTDLRRSLAERGSDWFPVVAKQLLTRLDRFHRAGWVFGDLKYGNILVSRYGDVELVDFGGATPFGHGVKLFTEAYDRGFWQAGSRIADPGYDLFAFAVLCLQLTDPEGRLDRIREWLPQHRNPEELLGILRSTPACRPVAGLLEEMIRGTQRRTSELAADWNRAVRRYRGLPAGDGGADAWIGICLLASIALFAGAAIFYFQ